MTSPKKNQSLLDGQSSIGMISAENPAFSPDVRGGHPALLHELGRLGLEHEETDGRYGGVPERSVIVRNPTVEQMVELGRKFGQESVIHSDNQTGHKMVYTNGEKQGTYNPGAGEEFYREPPDDYFTRLPGKGFVRIHFDFDKHLPLQAQQQRQAA